MSARDRWAPLVALVFVGCGTGPPTREPAPTPGGRPPVVELPERLPTAAGASFELWFPVDPRADPIGLEGLPRVLVTLATSEGQERAAAYGATLEGFSDGAIAGWRISGPAASFESLALIVLDLALDPRLPGTELATLAERWRERLRVRPGEAREAARRWAAALAVGEGRPIGVEPTDGTLALLMREDLVRLHRQLVRPERLRVASSHPIGPALAERLATSPGPAPPPPRACAAPTGRSFALPGSEPWDVVAALAPEPEVAEWRRALAPLGRHPSLAAAEARRLGERLVLVVDDATDAAAAWTRMLPRLGPRASLPAGLVAPTWVRVRVGGSARDATDLPHDASACRP
ncbi:MAG: hypothetical protein IT385_18705 [Deltaproteobacteria bacterium]|nr:hypothetical protein [Deltaproteobacteria bacterium]